MGLGWADDFGGEADQSAWKRGLNINFFFSLKIYLLFFS